MSAVHQHGNGQGQDHRCDFVLQGQGHGYEKGQDHRCDFIIRTRSKSEELDDCFLCGICMISDNRAFS